MVKKGDIKMLCQIEQCAKCGYCNRELDPDAYRAEARIIEIKKADKQALLKRLVVEATRSTSRRTVTRGCLM